MRDIFRLMHAVVVNITRKRVVEEKLKLKGYYPVIEHRRNGVLIGTYAINNGITNQGKNSLFDTFFNQATQSSSGSWCIGLIDNTSFSALAATDTPSSHTGWIEFTSYSQTNRVAWGQSSSSGQTVTNGSPATFDMTAGGNLAGIFITNVNTKSATTGILWSTGQFNATVPVSSGDELKITYAIAA